MRNVEGSEVVSMCFLNYLMRCSTHIVKYYNTHLDYSALFIIIIIIIIYTPTQVHRVTMVGGELKVTTSMYRR